MKVINGTKHLSHALAAFVLAPVPMLVTATNALAQEDSGIEIDDADLTEISLEDLMNINFEVTSVSKKSQSLRKSAAAVHVITAEDIRRAGATSLMEAFRMVPGLSVARINSSSYAISSRGFNGQFANKMLVLIDGRSVYTGLFSGVLWDQQGVMMEDIARIEVIRGPGAALWGANAVNGVINVITKTAEETQGGLITTLVGTEDLGIVNYRYGGETENGHYRVFGKYVSRDSLAESESGIEDDWEKGRVGFRADWAEGSDNWTFQGDFYRLRQEIETTQVATSAPFNRLVPWGGKHSGGNLIARWSRELEDNSEISVQAYVDRAEFRVSQIQEDRTNADIEFQHRLWTHAQNEFVWGFGYRHTSFDTQGTEGFTFDPAESTDSLLSLFVNNEYQFIPDELSVILGAKYEHNDYSGDEFQPNARLSWSPSDERTIWAAVSRAVRTPSQINHDLMLNLLHAPPSATIPLDMIFVLSGNEDFESEELIAYELGYRELVNSELSVDVATFFNEYDNLSTQELVGSPTPISATTLIQTVEFDNLGRGETYGAELAAQWVPSENLQLHVGYSYLHMELETTSKTPGSETSESEDSSPQQQAHLRIYYDFNEKTELDTALYFVDRLGTGPIDGYIRADIRIGRMLNDSTQLSLGVQGLFHDEEPEAATQALGGNVEVQAGAFISLTTSF